MSLTLNERERHEARLIILQASRKMLAHRPEIHYTQEPKRWEGIDHHLRVVKGQYPHNADCSSMATWMLYNALSHAKRNLHIPDIVNGEGWHSGFTGTQKEHGVRIGTHGTTPHKLVGDLFHYGGGNGHHVAVYIGGGWVFSHGSEPGPYKLRWNYRSDLVEVRRYIVAPH